MEWKNVLKDGLPENKQEVLISVKGINYIAVYNYELHGFEIDEYESFIPIKDVTIYWSPISNPFPKS